MDYNFPPQSGCNVTLPGPSLQSLCSAAEYIVFMTALDKAIRNNRNISGNCERIKPIDEPAEEYDFIVAGGGAGGAAVAGRLAEISEWKILVLEAGEDESAAGQIPSFAGSLPGSEIDWNYYTTNESYACLANNGSCYWASAKSLGGNTAHNQMICLRGNRVDFDNWAAQGNYGWAWDEVLKYYKKQEDNANIDEVGHEYHSTGGPLPVGYFPFVSEARDDFMKAAEESAFGVTRDLNGMNPTGMTVVQSTQKNGVRVSSASAYLRRHRNNKNLDISLKSHVTRIIIENNTAVGVEYIKNGKLRSVRAKREVIISSGTVKSPQLLLLSGIGPKEDLKRKGIKPVVDLPGVGQNLHDHVGFLLTFTINGADTFENNVAVANEYLQYQTGPMSTVSQFSFFGLGHSSMTTPDSPDYMISIHAYIASCSTGNINALRSNGGRKVSIWVENYHPESRGRVSLASNNPLEYPVLWANYLSNPKDLEVLLEGIEAALKLTETKALQAYNFTLAVDPPEACLSYTIPSREYWACAVRQNTQAGWHQAGSCKMGPASDPMAVVDPELRVHGMKHLRVVDASIMPQVTSGNTGTPTMMIGERGADFIKNTWLPSHSGARTPNSWNKKPPHSEHFNNNAGSQLMISSTGIMYDFPPQSGCNVTLPGPSLQSLCSAAEYIVFMTALDKAIRNNRNISGNCDRIKPIDEPAEEYDFIVAGGGAGGAAVAGRLAEISKWKILVLEAGEDESAAGEIPSFAGSLLGSEIDWNYYTTNESYACLSNNGSCYWGSAKCLGGNTAINQMICLRGNRVDFDNWAAHGNDGWAWDEVLKYYKKQEDNANIDEVGHEYHSTGGPLPVGYFPFVSEARDDFMKAAEESAFGVTRDLNGMNPTGMTVVQSTQKNGVRVSSASAYLRPHRDNKNLDISLKSHVTRIIIENNTAVGVEYIKNGKLRSVRAKREVIISLGALKSPQLLLLSGIGPKEHLKSKCIKLVSDLPGVGENLQDHVGFRLSFTINRADTFENNVAVANEYLQHQTGPMSTVSQFAFFGLGRSSMTSPDSPDFMISVHALTAGCAPGKINALRSNERPQVSIWVENYHPESRGRVSLASDDPLDYPVLWANYLSNPKDLEVLLEGIEAALKLTKTKALQAYNFTLAVDPPEACSNYTIPSREYWACAVRQNTQAGWHQAGSCKMGPASDPMAVVDPELRVHGIKNLRVADASIMPQVTSGNTATPTMMIGERGADFIKKTWLPSHNGAGSPSSWNKKSPHCGRSHPAAGDLGQHRHANDVDWRTRNGLY